MISIATNRLFTLGHVHMFMQNCIELSAAVHEISS